MTNQALYLCDVLFTESVCFDPELKVHPMFADIDFDNIHNLPAPFVPNPDNDTDTSYFDGSLLFYIILLLYICTWIIMFMLNNK